MEAFKKGKDFLLSQFKILLFCNLILLKFFAEFFFCMEKSFRKDELPILLSLILGLLQTL